jgi:hypothetical protein
MVYNKVTVNMESRGASSDVQRVKRSLQVVDRDAKARNDAVLQSSLGDEAMDVDQQPLIVREGVRLALEEKKSTVADDAAAVIFKCTIKKCNMDLELDNIDDLLKYHRECHPGALWRKVKCAKYNVFKCVRCYRLFKNAPDTVYREHLAGKHAAVNPTDIFPERFWSITIVATKTDVPSGLLAEYSTALNSVGCTLAIACLKRGDKENHLHLQSAAAICWDPADSKGLSKHFRKQMELDSKYADLTFKMQFKLFEQG